MKTPKFMQNPKAKMFFIWFVSFLGVTVFSLSTASIVLACIPKKYGIEFNYDNITSITYMNERQVDGNDKPVSKMLFNRDEEKHTIPMQEICKRLNKSRKSNMFMNIMRGNPDAVTLELNNTKINYNTDFKREYAQNGLEIWFATPTHFIHKSLTGSTSTLTTQGTKDEAIHGIFIPLDNTENKMQEQTLYLITAELASTQGTYINIPNKITTLANYHKVWEYVNDLFIKV